MFNSVRLAPRLAQTILGSFHLARLNLNYGFIHKISSRTSISSVTTLSTLKVEEYLNKLLQSNHLPGSLFNKDHSELKSWISTCLTEFEYEIYCRNLPKESSSEESIFNDKSFQIEIYELKDLLLAKDENERATLIKLFIDYKIKDFEKKQLKEKLKEIVPPSSEIQGLWNANHELVYGVGNNSLFEEISKDSVSLLWNRRLLSGTLREDSPRVVLDLSYVSHMDYLHYRQLCSQILILLYHNRHRTYSPFTVEFCENKATPHFNHLMTRLTSSWKHPRYFQYEWHHGKTVAQLASNPQLVYCISPTATEILTVEEVLKPEHVFVLPAYVCRNVFVSAFSEINLAMEQLGVNVRRLPIECMPGWKDGFSRCIQLNSTFAVLHNARYDPNFEWKAAFMKHLPQMIRPHLERVRSEKIKKRNKLIKKSYPYEQVSSEQLVDTYMLT